MCNINFKHEQQILGNARQLVAVGKIVKYMCNINL